MLHNLPSLSLSPMTDALEQSDQLEQRMRAVLCLPESGLPPSRVRPAKRGFIRDGEVPIAFTKQRSPSRSAPDSRLTIIEQSLVAERQRCQTAEQGLKDAQAKVQHLQTRLAHAEIATREALCKVGAITAPVPRIPDRRSSSPRPHATKTHGTKPVKWWIPGWQTRVSRAFKG